MKEIILKKERIVLFNDCWLDTFLFVVMKYYLIELQLVLLDELGENCCGGIR